MWILFGVLSGVILTEIACAYILKKENIIRLTVIGIVCYFSIYFIFSGLLFWLDVFSIEKVIVMIIIAGVAFNLFKFMGHKSIEVDFDLKLYLIPTIIIIFALPFTISKYEFFGMGQDEGVYQTQAIQFMYGFNDIQRDFEEYHMLESLQAKEEFGISLNDDLIGLYNYDPSLPFASQDKELSEVSAVFHGIPTFPALLALFGKMFGLRHMSDVQTIFYICSIYLIYFIFMDLNIKRTNRTVCTILFAVSPLILWVSKSALTEIGLVCLMLAFIYGFLSLKKEKIYLSLVPLSGIAFFHLTIYTMFPLFVLIFAALYIYRCEKVYLIALVIFNSMFAAGIFMTMMVAGTYTFTYNLWPIYRLPGISQKNVIWVFAGMIILTYILCITLCFLKNKLYLIKNLYLHLRYSLVRIVLISGVLYQGIIIMTQREKYQGGVNTFKHLTLTGYGFAVGIIIPAVAGVLWIFLAKKVLKDIRSDIIFSLFGYCILFYSCFMRKDIAYYFYYGRYLAPYVSIVLIFSAIVLNDLSRNMVVGMGLLSICILLPYERVLLMEKDDTRITWDALEGIIGNIQSETPVVIDSENMKFFYLTIRAMTSARCFPATDEVLREIESESEGYYYISNEEIPAKDAHLVKKEKFQLSEDNNVYDGKWIPFPLDVTKENMSKSLWYCLGKNEKNTGRN